MMATYHAYSQYSAYDPARRSSRAADHHDHFDRTTLYGSYGSRPDPRRDPIYRGYTLPTPIHDVDSDSSQGVRRRIQIACARCRKRKIKCSGDPGNASGCQACRSSGADVTLCTFERVGTTWKFGVDPNGNGQATTPSNSSYGSVGFLAGLSAEANSRPLSHSHPMSSTYDRGSFGAHPFDPYTFDLQHLGPLSTESPFADERAWTRAPSVGDYTTSYDASYRPLGITTLQGPPPPLERRLPAPNFVGTPMSPESVASPTAIVSGRLASLSISGPARGIETPPAGGPNSIQDLANASIMLPPVGRNPYKSIAPLQTPTDTSTQAYPFPTTPTEDLYAKCTSVAASSMYSTALPPIHLPPGSSRYSQSATNASASSKPPTAVVESTEDRLLPHHRHTLYPSENVQTEMYGWTTANETTDRRPSTTIHDESEGGQSYQPRAPPSPTEPCLGREGSAMQVRIDPLQYNPGKRHAERSRSHKRPDRG